MSSKDWLDSIPEDDWFERESIFESWPRVLTAAHDSACISAAFKRSDIDTREVARLAKRILSITFGIDARESAEIGGIHGAEEARIAIDAAITEARDTTEKFLLAFRAGGAEQIAMESQLWQTKFEAMDGLVASASDAIQAIDQMAWSLANQTLLACDLDSEADSGELSDESIDQVESSAAKTPIKEYPRTRLLARDKFIWENILRMSTEKLKQVVNNEKNFPGLVPITSGNGLKKAALHYSTYHKLPTRNFRWETPYSPTDTK